MNNSGVTPQSPVLLVDDEAIILKTSELTLKSHGITNVVTINDSRPPNHMITIAMTSTSPTTIESVEIVNPPTVNLCGIPRK